MGEKGEGGIREGKQKMIYVFYLYKNPHLTGIKKKNESIFAPTETKENTKNNI